MSYAKALREKLVRLSLDMRAIVDKAKAEENRGLTSEEAEKFDRLEKDYAEVEASIKRAEKADTIGNDLRDVDRDQIIPQLGDAKNKKEADPKHANAFSKYLRGGVESLNQEEKQIFAEKFVSNFGGTGMGIRNAQTLTTTGGGYLIPQGFSNQLEEAMKWYGGILGVVDTFDTETGNPLPWPTVNDTTNKGRIIGVNTQVTETDFTFGQTMFNSYIFCSDSVLVPLALMQDSYFDLDAEIAKLLGIRLGRLFNNKMTVGSGTNEPTGVQTAVIASANTVQGATGETTSIVYSDLVSVLHLVDPAYRDRAKFMFADSTLKILRQLKDSSNRPLWQPGLTAGFGQGFPETILDKPYVINNDMPAMAANAYSVLCGDFSKYKVRRVAGGTTVLRLVERYADYLQVGFIAFLRADGQLLDAGTHPIAAFQNSAT